MNQPMWLPPVSPALTARKLRIAATGASGQLGTYLQRVAPAFSNIQLQTLSRSALDLAHPESIRERLAALQFDVLINCAAYTAVDRAETEPEQAHTINARAVKVMAAHCKERGSVLLQLSTDYVFDGKSYNPYTENDAVAPESVYGQSKLHGEEAASTCPRQLILRTSWVYGQVGSNFLLTMLRLFQAKPELGIVYDQIGTPSYAQNLAAGILECARQACEPGFDAWGIYHFGNRGVASWYDFAAQIARETGSKVRLNPLLSAQYPTPAKRPHYSVLNKAKFESTFNFALPHWADGLRLCLSETQHT